MTANREKPEQLTFFFFEEMPKPTKGTIYLDTSKKGVGWGAKFGPEGSSIIGSPSGNPE